MQRLRKGLNFVHWESGKGKSKFVQVLYIRNRDRTIQQMRPIHTISCMRKRDLIIQQKRPHHMAKQTSSHIKRDVITRQNRPHHTANSGPFTH